MQREMRARLMVCVALVASGLTPAAARRNTARRRLIPGSGTSSTGRRRGPTRRSTSGRSPRHGSAVATRIPGRPGPGDAHPDGGSILTSAPRRSVRIGIRSRPSATRCSASSTRSRTRPYLDPQRRRDDPHAGGPLHRRQHNAPSSRRSRPASTTTSARARSRCCGLDAPAPSTTYKWAGASNLFPPAFDTPHRRLTARAILARRHLQRTNRPQQRRADGERQRQQPSALDPGHLRPRGADQRVPDRRWPAVETDPIKTGSIYNFRNLNAKQSRHLQAPRQGRLARVGDPHDRPAVHGPDRRRA